MGTLNETYVHSIDTTLQKVLKTILTLCIAPYENFKFQADYLFFLGLRFMAHVFREIIEQEYPIFLTAIHDAQNDIHDFKERIAEVFQNFEKGPIF
jgi:hypothetical protein